MVMAAQASNTAFNLQSLNLPSIGTLVDFYHACLGFPVKQMWLEAIKAGNCGTFDCLTYSNKVRCCPDTNETILGHLSQQQQHVMSTKTKAPKASPPPELPPTPPGTTEEPSNQVFVRVNPLSKLYTDDTGCFPVRACSGNQYVMIAFHANDNLILQQALKSKSNCHQISEYNAIMSRLAAPGHLVDLQILDNKTSAAYKEAITFKWHAKVQLAPPDMHHCNQAKCTICMFKDHFLAILAGDDSVFPPYLWDLFLPQAKKLTLNLLRQTTLNPRISVWEFFQGPFDFNKTLLGPVGCCVLIHAKLSTQRSWDFCAKWGFYIGPALAFYCCFKLVYANTKSQVISNTVKF